ncbi:MAG: hypothetical protein L6R39_002538 [Caloplaca ligustica]|nr:MAG: hypothetical protein L6R39_002538 [Caloplaca ligustica]
MMANKAAISTTHLPTVAFFGGTGGCLLAALSRALEFGYKTRALARTPSKLQDMLKERGLSQALLDERLVVVQGNSKDPEAIEKVLVEDGRVVNQIVFGIGGAPKFTPNPLRPTLDDPTVCQDSIQSIRTVLRRIKSSGQANQMPLLIALSTTGITDSRDIPILMVPLYHWMLAIPHADKKALEDRIMEARGEGTIRDYVIVRPSLFVDGRANGKAEIRVGWEGKAPGQPGEGAVIGYKITREDVGFFVFENVVAKDGGDFVGKKVSITH